MTPLQLTRSVRSLNRLRQIAQVLTRYGFGYVVTQLKLTSYVPVWMLRNRAEGPPLEEGASAIGRRLVRVCSELGPTFIKLGQMLSTRPDLAPPEALSELRTLQDDVPPFETAAAMDIIEQALGRSASACFASIEERPFASASIGQVYRAKLHDGSDVVVKVRRPDIESTIRLDMQLLHWMAESLEHFMPELRAYRPALLVAELEELLTRELDYVNEASVTARFGQAFQADSGIRIPKVHWDLCGSQVLTLEALGGTNVESLLSVAGSTEGRVDRRLIAHRLAHCYLKQVFELGTFHADPHPGNILVEPPASVGLIDFGQVGTITGELMTQLVVMVYAFLHRELEVVIDALADLGALGVDTNRSQLLRALQSLMDKYYGLPLKRVDLGTLTYEFADVVRRHDVVVPRDLLMLAKTLSTLTSVTTRLDPDLDLIELLKPQIKRALARRFSPEQLARGTLAWGWNVLGLLRHGPGELREFLRGLRSGSWKLPVRHENLERLVSELDRSSNRLAFSMVIAAIIVGSSVVVSAGTELKVLGLKLQYLGILGYVLAGFLGLGLSWAIFRSGRLH